jgi:hypothetical protein
MKIVVKAAVRLVVVLIVTVLLTASAMAGLGPVPFPPDSSSGPVH